MVQRQSLFQDLSKTKMTSLYRSLMCNLFLSLPFLSTCKYTNWNSHSYGTNKITHSDWI